jgi:hypothetical protein
MNALQLKHEIDSVQVFVDDVVAQARKRGTDAATTSVIMATARAAAEMAPRKADGAIDFDIARIVILRAVRSLSRLR